MKIDIKDFRVGPGSKVKLDKWPTLVKPLYDSRKEYKSLLDAQVAALSAQQEIHYADNRYAVLVILQAMDAAGKDSAIKHVMSGINPQGCQVFSKTVTDDLIRRITGIIIERQNDNRRFVG